MEKFCANKKCAAHILVRSDQRSWYFNADGHQYKVERRALIMGGKTFYFCDICKNAIDMCSGDAETYSIYDRL